MLMPVFVMALLLTPVRPSLLCIYRTRGYLPPTANNMPLPAKPVSLYYCRPAVFVHPYIIPALPSYTYTYTLTSSTTTYSSLLHPLPLTTSLPRPHSATGSLFL
ncbi:hypothetical protein CC80DRAFT_310038 [Byssothecium circinans]|uniref:Secreted protein n=1 Tax=Byssothecium circinans TaxID=147558 RepID=A0A6A5U7C3_9PLEO|nr:hypothetical protein CC80DRAFT_310038 [Byssothecium circinans]